MNGSDVKAEYNKSVPIKKEETSYNSINVKQHHLQLKKTQFSLVLSRAYSVCKVQGLSITSAVSALIWKNRSLLVLVKCMLL